jgi:hypothetical protein
LENLFSLLTGASPGIETFFAYRGMESGFVNSKRNSHIKGFVTSRPKSPHVYQMINICVSFHYLYLLSRQGLEGVPGVGMACPGDQNKQRRNFTTTSLPYAAAIR